MNNIYQEDSEGLGYVMYNLFGHSSPALGSIEQQNYGIQEKQILIETPPHHLPCCHISSGIF